MTSPKSTPTAISSVVASPPKFPVVRDNMVGCWEPGTSTSALHVTLSWMGVGAGVSVGVGVAVAGFGVGVGRGEGVGVACDARTGTGVLVSIGMPDCTGVLVGRGGGAEFGVGNVVGVGVGLKTAIASLSLPDGGTATGKVCIPFPGPKAATATRTPTAAKRATPPTAARNHDRLRLLPERDCSVCPSNDRGLGGTTLRNDSRRMDHYRILADFHGDGGTA